MRECSDTLLIFTLKGRNPKVFGDRVKQEHSVRQMVEDVPEKRQYSFEFEDQWIARSSGATLPGKYGRNGGSGPQN